ncbi:hypothetical protein K491DRAFT_199549 [Lophiostoma macrostomum CBS 122681]|uniref:Uncharacterized protein n=1 Tax=Lophiostoma macrostomum CBS 122681 TaxID=1314788 RepID=A0A6A6SPR8_9PLEO|nr:hypothetical protein K491DRAFT_199549 [Lophiostoma macrostomum CBS 122681]
MRRLISRTFFQCASLVMPLCNTVRHTQHLVFKNKAIDESKGRSQLDKLKMYLEMREIILRCIMTHRRDLDIFDRPHRVPSARYVIR